VHGPFHDQDLIPDNPRAVAGPDPVASL